MYINKVIDNLSVKNPSLENPFVVFPYLATDILHLTNVENIQNITIHDVLRKQSSSVNVRSDQIEIASYS